MDSDRNIIARWIPQWIRQPPPRNPLPYPIPKNLVLLSQVRTRAGRSACQLVEPERQENLNFKVINQEFLMDGAQDKSDSSHPAKCNPSVKGGLHHKFYTDPHAE